MSARLQYRIDFSTPGSAAGGTCFIDAASEDKALKFFAQAFPRQTVVSIKLEAVDPCARYERRETKGAAS